MVSEEESDFSDEQSSPEPKPQRLRQEFPGPKPVEASNQKPSLGRIVLYTNRSDAKDPYPVSAHAAIITRVEPPPAPPEPPLPVDPKSKPGAAPKQPPMAIPQDPMKVSLFVFRYNGKSDTEHGVEFTTSEPGSEEARGKWCWAPRV
jgi:hypothetical protein